MRRLVVPLAATSFLLAAATLALRWLARGQPMGEYWAFNACVAVGFTTAGAVIALRRVQNPIGWLFLAGGIGNGITGAGTTYASYALGVRGGDLPAWESAFWLASWTWVLVPTGIILTLALFPDGRPLTRRWRGVVALAVVGSGLWMLALATCHQCPANGLPTWIPREGPFRMAVSDRLLPLGPLLLNLSGVAAVVSLVLRYRRGSADQRQQLKWLALAAIPLVASFIVFIFGTSGGVWVSTASVTLFALPVALAVLKYRLYEIDIVLNRALVYLTVSGLLWGLWIVVVVTAGRAVTGNGTVGISLMATGLIAVLALPARAIVQQVVDRVMYGRRRDPFGVVTALSRQLSAAVTPETLLSNVLRELGDTLKLGHISVAVAGEPSATGARDATDEPLLLPLVYQGESVGTLKVEPRRGDRLSARDRRLLDTLLPHLAVTLHAVRLRRDLQRSRERLVTVLEEERRRLRRDLHDGIGPTLTAVAFRTDTIRNLLSKDLESADRLLGEARAEITEAIAEIRRLVYDLRPPALDELGLVGALRQQASRFAQTAGRDGDGAGRAMEVEVEAPERLPPLPAAVEVAGYRIASEAITNAARHARASCCLVRISLDHELDIDVTDDGQGWSEEAVAGVGVVSMRERASELGGTLKIVSRKSAGTRVHARLPLSPEAR